MTDLLVQEDADDLTAALRACHHSVCRHFSQVAAEVICDWYWTLTRADQRIVKRTQPSSPIWTVTFNEKRRDGGVL